MIICISNPTYTKTAHVEIDPHTFKFPKEMPVEEGWTFNLLFGSLFRYWTRNRHKPMDVAELVALLGRCGAKQIFDPKRIRCGELWILKPFKITKFGSRGFEGQFKTGEDRPRINEIKDYRRRQAPFMADGTCRG